MFFRAHEDAVKHAHSKNLDLSNIRQVFERCDIELAQESSSNIKKLPPERYNLILSEYLEGKTLRQIAIREGVSSARVGQIIKETCRRFLEIHKELSDILKTGSLFTLESVGGFEEDGVERIDFVKQELFTTRTTKRLVSANYRYIDELVNLKRSDLLKMQGMGKKSVDEVFVVLHCKMGLPMPNWINC